jgi:hypothetical protein
MSAEQPRIDLTSEEVEQARLKAIADQEAAARAQADALALVDEHLQGHEDEMTDAQDELQRIEFMLREARDRAARVKFDLEKARQTAEQERRQLLGQGQGEQRGNLGQGNVDPNAQGGLNGGQNANQHGASGSDHMGPVGPPPGFGQAGPQYGQQNFQDQYMNQQQPGPTGGQGFSLQGLPKGVAGFIDYMGSSGQFGPVQKQPTPASERGYSFPNQDLNFGQQPAGRPVDFMLHGMLGFQSSGQARGPGGNTSGLSHNPDPDASISLTGQAPHNSNNQHGHPDRIEFGRNPYKLEGIKEFGHVPILGGTSHVG